jgi:D-3-phosphoglycerate dehydrogenase / 2-oxoglutarate reductase
MSQHRLLISTSSFGLRDSNPLNRLEQANIEYTLNPFKQTLSTSQLIDLLEGVQYLIAGTEKITMEVFQKCPQLRIISRCGSGLDNVDLAAAAKNNVAVLATSEAPVLSVAELTLALILNTLRFIRQSDQGIRSGKWVKHMGNLLTGKTVGILGFGKIGEKVAELLKPFYVKILAHDIRQDKNMDPNISVEYVSLNELLQQSDILTIHLPYEPSTHHLIGEKDFALMKENAILVNTSRGGIVDEDALSYALKQERLKAAAIDVFAQEPYSGKLTDLDNVLLTAHIGSYTAETRDQMENQAVENLLRSLEGRKI